MILVRPRPSASSLRQHRRQTPPAAGLQEIHARSSGAGKKQVAGRGTLELPHIAAAEEYKSIVYVFICFYLFTYVQRETDV